EGPGGGAGGGGNRGGEDQARDRLVPDPTLGQNADGVGAGAEEGGLAQRDDAGVAEDQVEGDREQDRDQELGAEAEIFREGEEERERQDPGDRLPRARPMAPGQRERRGMIGPAGFRRRHVTLVPKRPWGRQSRSRIVNA